MWSQWRGSRDGSENRDRLPFPGLGKGWVKGSIHRLTSSSSCGFRRSLGRLFGSDGMFLISRWFDGTDRYSRNRINR